MMYMAGCVRLNKCSYLEILDISSIGHHNQSANQHYVKLVEPFSPTHPWKQMIIIQLVGIYKWKKKLFLTLVSYLPYLSFFSGQGNQY